MKNGSQNPTKELYQKLRLLPWHQLWDEEVARFDQDTPSVRLANVALIRAVGVVFSESGDMAQKFDVARWLRALLRDPEEKIRRYAMAALPKVGAGEAEEEGLIELLKNTTNDREKKFLGKSLNKIGGAATLDVLGQSDALTPRTELKVRARVARQAAPSIVLMEASLAAFSGLRIHLRGRRGLEQIVRSEVTDSTRASRLFRVREIGPGVVSLLAIAPFSLSDLYSLRCFGTLSFVLGKAGSPDEIAQIIVSSLSQNLFRLWTQGPLRYRLDFVGKGHQRGAVHRIAEAAFARCPNILNDASEAPWSVDILSQRDGDLIELRPRLTPDPRFHYRRQDVPAASHPPMAACMARLAGPMSDEIVWDPFCGSGLELIERTFLGGVRRVLGSDRSAEAIAIAADNFAAAGVPVASEFHNCDFRDFARTTNVAAGSISLIVTNPPLGKRVPIPNLGGLIRDLFAVAEKMLRPGGRLVFANPIPSASRYTSLVLQSSRAVDFGGFDCRLEHYVKSARPRVFPQKSAAPRA